MPLDTLNPPRRGFWTSVKDRLWGYDFFISYHWTSGGLYAVNLAQRLREKHYDVFLDRADYASGDDWKAIGERALRNTQRLVLIATREAVTISKPVEREVRLFTDRNRQVISIVFGDRFEELDRSLHLTLNRMSDSQLYIEDGKETLASGPSDKIVTELIRTQGVMRRRNLRAMLTLIPVVAVIAFAAFATVSWANASLSARNERDAKQAEKLEKEHANAERDNAINNLADANRQSANVFWELAVNARDREGDVIWATQLFLRGEGLLERLPQRTVTASDTAFRGSFSMAAHNSDRSVSQSFLHDAPIRGAQFSHDESRVLTWGDDKTARLWDVTKAQLIQTFQHESPVSGAQFSHDESRLLTWSDDKTLLMWDKAVQM